MKQYRSRHQDSQFIDEIRIVTIPRYKQSGMSGDEWRISAQIQFYKKGQLLGTDHFHNIETSARFLDWAMTRFREDGKVNDIKDADKYCDQEGCNEMVAVTYKKKFDYCKEGHETTPIVSTLSGVEPSVSVRKFCTKHATRGDCGLDDADRNYELIV